ncbi:MAG: winged helix-turn-helix transcriptional regulator [Clostridia bacterium]|nr:winged helix-turn-helix transcriptional regulator [Clostridia bacterium]
MEIISPGKLPSIITLDNIKNERYARNPQISRVLTELGLVKELNEGVARIYKEMKDFFLEEPEYSEPNNMLVKLVLKNNIVMRSKRKNENLLKDENIRNNWEELNVLEQKTLQYIHDKGEASTKDISEFIDRSKRTAIRILNKLEDIDLIEWVGTSPQDPKKIFRVKQNK